MNFITLGNRIISPKSRPYVIAEIGVNHEGSLDLAKRLIELAKEGGADAAKFQTYKADTLAVRDSPFYWDLSSESTRSQHELFKKYDSFNAPDYVALAEYCTNVGIEFLSTPFDDAAIEFLDPLVRFYKIASADLNNLPFLKKVAAKGKPVVLATGASTLPEISMAVDTLSRGGCHDIALLHCVLNYPTKNVDAHLGMIRGLQRSFPNFIIGYSDHTHPDESMIPLLTAHMLGAVILEKHFTHDKMLPGNDHYHAMDVNDLKRFQELVNRAHSLIGDLEVKSPLASENVSRRNARRSLVLRCDLPAGHHLTADDLTYKRPGTGIGPEHWDEVIGQALSRNCRADEILKWSMLE